jgi:dTMP kinase
MNCPAGTYAKTHLIAIIGIDGAGKSTQIAVLHDYLTRHGQKVTALPTESLDPLWRRLDVLAGASGEDVEGFLGVDMVQMLASCIKWISFEKTWSQLDGSDGVLLADRYSYCHIAIAQRAGERTRTAIEHLYGGFPEPDVCIWLDTSPETALERLRMRGENWHDLDFLETHRRGYLELAARHGFTVVDGEGPSEVVTARLVAEMHRALPELFAAKSKGQAERRPESCRPDRPGGSWPARTESA